MKSKRKPLTFFLLETIFLLLSPVAVLAADATLFFSPVTGVFNTGDPIVVRVMVSSENAPINAVEGVFRYDPKEVEIISFDRSASFLSSWTQEPTVDQEKGEVVFAGAMSGTSSFSGVRGEVFALTMKGLRSEETRLDFGSGSASAIRAADGTGGNLLSALSSGVYIFAPREARNDETFPEAVASDVSLGEVLGVATGTLVLSSETHPDQDAWYGRSSATIKWEMSEDVSGVRLLLDRRPTGNGLVYYAAPRSTREIEDIPDGVWYVHLTREWESGETDLSHYRVQIDTEPPQNVTVSEVPREDTTDPSPFFAVTATDTLSGVARYEFAFDDREPISWVDDGTGAFRAPVLPPGAHTLVVAAIDRAGNRATAQVSFAIEAIPAPVLELKDAERSREGDPLRVSVSAIPSSTVYFSVGKEGDSPASEQLVLDDSGVGVFQSALVPGPGRYTISAIARKGNGAESLRSEEINVLVRASFFGMIKRNPFVPVAIFGLLAMLVGGWFVMRRVRSRDDAHEVSYSDVTQREDESSEAKEEVVHSSRFARPVTSSGVVVLGGAKNQKKIL